MKAEKKARASTAMLTGASWAEKDVASFFFKSRISFVCDFVNVFPDFRVWARTYVEGGDVNAK